MATQVFEPCAKSRTRRTNLFGFRTFPTQSTTGGYSTPCQFRDNIRLFLPEFAQILEQGVAGSPTWSTLLVNEENGAVFPLYTVEETVDNFSLTPFCQHCKGVGWGHHFMSKRRYHLIILAGDKWDKPLQGSCLVSRGHRLYGLIHCNGFGHLLCINGIEQGSTCIPLPQIMNLWDRICKTLQTRYPAVTGHDVKCMEC